MSESTQGWYEGYSKQKAGDQLLEETEDKSSSRSQITKILGSFFAFILLAAFRVFFLAIGLTLIEAQIEKAVDLPYRFNFWELSAFSLGIIIVVSVFRQSEQS